ncbi:MAG: hypothetical protein ACREMY_25365, partial [bacterium]
MNPNAKQSPKAGILMVLSGILYVALGFAGIEHNQDLASLLYGGHFFLGIPVRGVDALEALAISAQSGFVVLLGGVVSVLGLI